jgi:hypothetical protein
VAIAWQLCGWMRKGDTAWLATTNADESTLGCDVGGSILIRTVQFAKRLDGVYRGDGVCWAYALGERKTGAIWL